MGEQKIMIEENNGMQKVIVICGPTASGKTALSIELAKKINRRNYISRFYANLSRYEYW